MSLPACMATRTRLDQRMQTRVNHAQLWVRVPVVLEEGGGRLGWADMDQRNIESCLIHARIGSSAGLAMP